MNRMFWIIVKLSLMQDCKGWKVSSEWNIADSNQSWIRNSKCEILSTKLQKSELRCKFRVLNSGAESIWAHLTFRYFRKTGVMGFSSRTHFVLKNDRGGAFYDKISFKYIYFRLWRLKRQSNCCYSQIRLVVISSYKARISGFMKMM